MQQFAFLNYRHVQTEFAFKLRTKNIRLADIIPMEEIIEQMDYAQYGLSYSLAQIHYLRGLKNEQGKRIFCDEFLNFLSTFKLSDYHIKRVDGNYDIRPFGDWCNASPWETFIMSIVNELYYDHLGLNWDGYYREGRRRTNEKVRLLKQYPELRFMEFGTRRRHSALWQDEVIETLATELPRQLTGTSNVHTAMEKNLIPRGTVAHEPTMIMSGIMGPSDEGILKSHNAFIEQWYNLYGYSYAIDLTDTYGTDFFFRDLTKQQAIDHKGLREDSAADPFYFGDEQAIPFYEKNGINPKDKLIVFSNNLTVPLMIDLHKHFHSKVKDMYGPGTNLSNDLGVPAISIVVKPVKANGQGLVKLSDNLAKAIGEPSDIERYKRIFSYNQVNHQYIKCTY